MSADNTVRVIFEAVTGNIVQNINQVFNEAENRVEDFGRKTSGFLEAGFAGVSAAITTKLLNVAGQASAKVFDTLFGDPTKVASEFQAQMSQVKAISGATEDELETLAAAAKKIGAETMLSASQGVEALKYMAMSGWDTSQMTAALEPLANLAIASGEDLAKVTDIVTDGMTAFGLQASEATRFTDVLAAATSGSNTTIGMMGETFKYVAPVAGALGFSIEDAATASGMLANTGIKASQAGTVLKATMNKLINPTGEAKKLVDQLNISVTNQDGSMKSLGEIVNNLRGSLSGLSEAQQAQYAATLVGEEAMAGLLSIVNTSEADYNKLTKAIQNSSGAAQEMAEIMGDNLQGKITQVKSKWESWNLTIGETMLGSLENGMDSLLIKMDEVEQSGAIDKIAEGLGRLTEIAIDFLIDQLDKLPSLVDTIANGAAWLADNFDLIKNTLQSMAEIFIFTKIYEGVSTLSGGLSSLIQFVKQADGSFKLLNATMKANIFIFIISLVLALVMRFNELYRQTGDVKTAFQVLLMEIGKSALNFANIVLTAINLIFTALERLFGQIPLIGDLFGYAADASKKAMDAVSTKVQGLSQEIDALLNKSGEISVAVNYENDRQTQLDEQRDMHNYKEKTKPVTPVFQPEAITPSTVPKASSGGSTQTQSFGDEQTKIINDNYKYSISVIESRREVAQSSGDIKTMNINTLQLEQVLNNKLNALNNALFKATKQSDKDQIETERNKVLKEISETTKGLQDNIRASLSEVGNRFSSQIDVIGSRLALAEKNKDKTAFQTIGETLLETLKEKLFNQESLMIETEDNEQLNILETERNRLLLEILHTEEKIAGGFGSLVGEFNKPSKLGTLTQYQSETMNSNTMTNRTAVNNHIAMYVTLENLDKKASEKMAAQTHSVMNDYANGLSDFFMHDVRRGGSSGEFYM